MKKYISLVLATLTVLFCFAACSKKIYTDPDEYSKAVSESNEEASASEAKRNQDIEDAKEKTGEEVGKSVKNKKLVLRRNDGNTYEYQVLNFDSSGKLESSVRYIYCNDDSTYDSKIESIKTEDNKIKESDEYLRYMEVKYTDLLDMSYSDEYEEYSNRDSYEIIK